MLSFIILALIHQTFMPRLLIFSDHAAASLSRYQIPLASPLGARHNSLRDL